MNEATRSLMNSYSEVEATRVLFKEHGLLNAAHYGIVAARVKARIRATTTERALQTDARY